MIVYDRIFDAAIDRLHSEGRYRFFIDILRNKGAFPNARCFAHHNAYHAGERDGSDKITTAIEAIERLYSDHIWKEDDMVFPMAVRLIPAKDRERLFIQFTEVEARNPPGTHERFHDFAKRLALAGSH
jgi:hypothetical protein